MTKKEKLVERLKQMPADFTFDEAARLLSSFGYTMSNKGKTSGSKVMFIDKHNRKILLHKPHPGNILLDYALRQIIIKLERNNKI